jgi:hypothetical protein
LKFRASEGSTGFCVGIGSGEIVGIGEEVDSGVGVATGTGTLGAVGFGLVTRTPLFHFRFFPDLRHVYVLLR